MINKCNQIKSNQVKVGQETILSPVGVTATAALETGTGTGPKIFSTVIPARFGTFASALNLYVQHAQ